jgi:hypothetical protein
MKPRVNGAFVWTCVLGLFVLLFVVVAGGFPVSLQFTPYLAGYGTLAMIVVLLAGNYYPEILRWTETTLQDLWGGGKVGDDDDEAKAPDEDAPWPAVLRSMAYAVGFMVFVFLLGFPVVTPTFIALYLIVEARVPPVWGVLVALATSVGLVVGMLFLNVEVWAGIGPEIVEDFIGGAIMPPL